MFNPVPSNVSFPKLEEEILGYWRNAQIYQKSLQRRRGAPRFVFYEGPPTANGMPHPGHCLTRAIKDLFPRYQTMRGRLCERKAGWDTHGLPVEVEVCKELGIHSKEDIEKYGVEPFIQKCQQSVWRYMQEWERMTERIGFWVNLKEAYVTYHQSYVESVWWSLKQLFDRGLLYRGHKIVWWWAQGGTALSAGEVGLGYREVADPSVYVKFPLVPDERTKALGLDGASLLVWTTTPWTLPSNQFAAVHPDLEYAIVTDPLAPGESPGAGGATQRVIIASALVETIAGKIKRELSLERTLSGRELIGLRYVPPFDHYYALLMNDPSEGGFPKASGVIRGKLLSGDWRHPEWRIVSGDFVTLDSGTGLVHIAPAFGEVDFAVLEREQKEFVVSKDGFVFDGPSLRCPVSPNGEFAQDGPEYCRGRWVKECDKDITRDLKQRGFLFHQEQYVHEYPFCWRAEEDPLIQYPRRSWFIRTSQFKEAMLENNRQINWLPEHIKEGRFGKFLESNVDWALSRERFWGTPLPIWVCEKTGKMEAVGNYDDLLKKSGVRGTDVWEKAKKANPVLVDDLKVHVPYIDAVTYDSPFSPGARMRRVKDVIDCWYDSGAMPFAQWGFLGKDGSADRTQKFEEQFPADFISEALDQTRGWFYSQLAISTLLFEKHPYPHPFRNCIVLGLMLGEDGQKMSKSKRNYREPGEIFDKYGADALRWFFFATQPPWTTIRYSERAIRDSIPEFLLRLWNVYSFFVIYANIDGFDPSAELAGGGQRVEKSKSQTDTSTFGLLDSSTLAAAETYRPIKDRAELDRWILSELNRTAAAVVERMDAYDNYAAAQRIIEFVDALSNWYVRRSRDRFWSEDKRDPDKLDAYWTLYECLLTTAKIVAPFVPFLAEAIWRNLATAEFEDKVLESVHLTDFPSGDPATVDERLSAEMALVREISSLGRAARMGAKLKVRQPLAKVEVILADPAHQAWLEQHVPLIRDELNVKQVEFTQKADQYITYTVLPDLKRLGPRLGKRLPLVKNALSKADAGKLLAEMEAAGSVSLKLEDGSSESLDREDLQVRLQAKPGWAAAQGRGCVVVLATELTPELVNEALGNELVHAIQQMRKDTGREYTDRIEVRMTTNSNALAQASQSFEPHIKRETLATIVKCIVDPAIFEAATDPKLRIGDYEAVIEIKKSPDPH